MVSKYFMLSCVLLQGLVVVACENSQPSLNKSNGELRKSQGGLSTSQGLSESPRVNGAADIYYISPCCRKPYDPKQEMKPMDRWHNDCP